MGFFVCLFFWWKRDICAEYGLASLLLCFSVVKE